MPRRHRHRPDHRRAAIADEAARIMQEGGLGDFRNAKARAGARLGLEDRGALPSNREIEKAMAERNRIFRAEEHEAIVDVLRGAALRVMEQLAELDPRLVGPVLSGSATEHNDIELHVFSDAPEALGSRLDELGLQNRAIQHRLRMRRGEATAIPGYRFRCEGFDFCALVFPERGRGNAPLSPVDGRPMRRATAAQLTALLRATAPLSGS